MDAVELSDGVQRLIAEQVAAGRATSAAAFVEEAVLRLVDDAAAEAVRLPAEAGVADAAAGRMTTVATDEDAQAPRTRMVERLRTALGA
jgi:Arc/MetJ-type ribon-helix-helix transcriptional regulator